MAEELPRIFGDFVLLSRLGGGVSSQRAAYLARPRALSGELPSPLVVKVLERERADGWEAQERFEHEARVALAIDSPYVAKVFEMGTIDDALYIALEYVEGWTLGDVFEALVSAKRTLTIAEALAITEGALLGLGAVHSARDPRTGGLLEVAHRDISPANLILRTEGRSCVIDFGLGRSSLKTWRTKTGALMGSPGYAAPEQVTGQPADARADVYAMGVLLFEALTLAPYVPRATAAEMFAASAAMSPRPPSSLRSDLPPELDAIVLRALSIDPPARPSSCAELHAELVRAARPASVEEIRALVSELFPVEARELRTDVGWVAPALDLPRAKFPVSSLAWLSAAAVALAIAYLWPAPKPLPLEPAAVALTPAPRVSARSEPEPEEAAAVKRTHTIRKDSPAPEPEPEPPPPEPTIEDTLARITSACAAARRAHPEKIGAINDILAEATLWGAAKDRAAALAAFADLEAQLSRTIAP